MEPVNGADQGGVLDLGAAMAPPRRIRLPGDTIATLGIGELLEVARLVGRPYNELGGVLRGADASEAALVALALAFVLTKRLEPDVTWADAQRWRIEIPPSAADPSSPGPTTPTS